MKSTGSRKAIFLFDRTGIMAQPWLDAGFECWCFDGQHPEGITREDNLVKVGTMFDAYNTTKHVQEIKELVGSGVEFVFGFPECTDLAVSGAAHFAKKIAANPACQAEAAELARFVMYVGNAFNVPWGCENPVSVLSTIWRKPNFNFNPADYGGYLPEDDVHPLYPDNIIARDAYTKKTCIWCGNGFIEPKRKPVPVAPEVAGRQSKLGGKSQKTKNIRSATPRGFALAVSEANII